MRYYIPSLNGLRALSIILVILGHIHIRSFGNAPIVFPFSIFFDSSFGVNVFFVISGFLITTLLIREQDATGEVNLKNFYIRRFFRIFPAYYFLLLVYLVLQVLGIFYFSRASWLSSIFYYKYLAGGDWESGHFWSLSVEEHFYLVWPMVFILLGRYRVYFAVAVVLMVAFFRYNAYEKIFPSPLLSLNVSLFQRVDAIMIGCLAALYKDYLSTMVQRIRGFAFSPYLILLLIALFNSEMLTDLNARHHLHLGMILVPLGIGGTSTGLLSNLLIALLLLISISWEGGWYKLLNTRTLNFIGKLSYSLYLWQQMFFSPRVGLFSSFPVNIACAFLCALGSYYFIERPFLRLKDRYETAKPGRADTKKLTAQTPTI